MDKIHLLRSDLEKLIQIVDDLNPPNTTQLAAGMVTIKSDSSSGIGTILTAEVQVTIKGHHGKFTVVLSDESSW